MKKSTKFEPVHVKLKQGKIQIPGGRHRNSRILELKSFQVIEITNYLNEILPQILKELDKPKPARKPAKVNMATLENKLFVSVNRSEYINNSLHHLFKNLRKIIMDIQDPSIFGPV